MGCNNTFILMAWVSKNKTILETSIFKVIRLPWNHFPDKWRIGQWTLLVNGCESFKMYVDMYFNFKKCKRILIVSGWRRWRCTLNSSTLLERRQGKNSSSFPHLKKYRNHLLLFYHLHLQQCSLLVVSHVWHLAR